MEYLISHQILWEKPVRTGQQDNYSTNIGFSATLSFPLDGGLQERCKEAADTHTALMQQNLANKRLDFEIARLKNCGELMKSGISFHPKSRYYAICADVVVQNVNTIPQHRHSIPSSSLQSSRVANPSSHDTYLQQSQMQTTQLLPNKVCTFVNAFFTTGFTTLNKRSARGFANIAEEVATTAIDAVAVTAPAVGRLPTICATTSIFSVT